MSGTRNVHSRLLIASLMFGVIFLSYEVVLRSWDLYRTAPDVDLPGHFLSGMASCAFLYWLMRVLAATKPHRRAIALALAVALLWEAVEVVQEWIFPDPVWLHDYFWWDGFFDVVAALLGSFAAFPVLRWLRDRVVAFRPMDV